MILGRNAHIMRLDLILQKHLSMVVYSASKHNISLVCRGRLNDLMVGDLLIDLNLITWF